MFKNLSENVAYSLPLAPVSRTEVGGTSGVYTGTYVSLVGYKRAQILLVLGDITAGETVDFSLVQATDTSGTSSKALTGTAITQIADTGDNTIYSVEIDPNQLDEANGFITIAPKLTIAGASAAVLSAVLVLRHQALIKPIPTASNGLTQNVKLLS